MKIIVYHSDVIHIGGIETLDYNWCKQLSKYYDVLFLYKKCHYKQLERISRYVNFEQYDPNKEYKCDICISMSSWDGYPDTVIASTGRYIQMIHANYKELLKANYRYIKWNKTTEHLAVSNTVRDIFNELYNENSKTMYNILDDIQDIEPIKIDGDENCLKLISATRLSSEKGYPRMIKLATALKEKGIKFKWLIFTDLNLYKDIHKMDIDGVIYMEPTYDIFPYMKWADYGVQLSDTEGWSYFINECLQYNTPLLLTNFDSAYESVVDGVNGFLFDMQLSNLNLEKIVNNIPSDFEYKPKSTIKDWIAYLGDSEYKYRECNPIENRGNLEIKSRIKYKDNIRKIIILREKKILEPLRRAKEICMAGYADVTK